MWVGCLNRPCRLSSTMQSAIGFLLYRKVITFCKCIRTVFYLRVRCMRGKMAAINEFTLSLSGSFYNRLSISIGAPSVIAFIPLSTPIPQPPLFHLDRSQGLKTPSFRVTHWDATAPCSAWSRSTRSRRLVCRPASERVTSE